MARAETLAANRISLKRSCDVGQPPQRRPAGSSGSLCLRVALLTHLIVGSLC